MVIEFGFRSDQDNSRDEIELSFEELDEWISSVAEQEIPLESFNEWMLERQYNRCNGILDHNYLERAFPLIKEAVEKGHTRYYKYLGDCYYYGYGSDVSYDDAAKAYLMSFLYHPRILRNRYYCRAYGSGRFCHHFCPVCGYYSICKEDGMRIL
ncbi:MAG: hypothetical protein K5696_01100 [Lachnospiraceae bacterium]|nr:hypothetical protein [Lachnospiraceae bacterium]